MKSKELETGLWVAVIIGLAIILMMTLFFVCEQRENDCAIEVDSLTIKVGTGRVRHLQDVSYWLKGDRIVVDMESHQIDPRIEEIEIFKTDK